MLANSLTISDTTKKQFFKLIDQIDQKYDKTAAVKISALFRTNLTC